MRMPKTLAAALLAVAAIACGPNAAPVSAEPRPVPFLDYRSESWFLPQSPSVMGGPAAGLFNPAAWAMNDRTAMDTWAILNDSDRATNQYGTSFGRNLGLAMQTHAIKKSGENFRVFDYALGLAGGDEKATFGVSYRWSTGDTEAILRQSTLSGGVILRPGRWISCGASATTSMQSDAGQYVFDFGVRPFGRSWLTLFGDWTAGARESFFDDGTWGAGLEMRPYRGVHLGGRIRRESGGSNLDYLIYAGLTVDRLQVLGLPLFNEHGDHQQTTLLRRSHPPIPGLSLPALDFGGKPNRYYPVNLENRVLTYQKYRWFDSTNVAWLDLLKVLNRVRDDEDIDGVVFNLAGFRGRPSLLWEMRVKLLELRETGKEIVVHIDRPAPVVYYLATAADRISVDPWGNVSLPGFALSRSYLKGTLEKLGVGFQEFRYFKYKSAMETFARTEMSEADREQRQRIVDVVYDEVRSGVADGRGLTGETYDRIVDDLAVLGAREALDAGLVDAVARWDDVSEWLGEERDGKLISPRLRHFKRRYRDKEWGRPLRIPVVFAVGSCAMDSGIRGRATSAYLRGLIGDPTVPAVVLRADSPGGDPLPSDLVADAIRQLKEAGKPVIISQGDVAASGGYWISMDGTEILTTPLTITGSIGVIGGWVWDDGLGEKAGITSDAVQRGRHADLMSLVRYPFLGGLPRRPMDEAELARVEKVITTNYDEFVNAVAIGRGLEPETVGEIAQGRVWMGGDAVERGLCDRFGTLDEAIRLARALAGVPEWRTVEIVEYPPRHAFRMPGLLPSIPSLIGLDGGDEPWPEETTATDEANTDAEQAALLRRIAGLGLSVADVEYLQAITASPGRPLLRLGPGLLPTGWGEPLPEATGAGAR